MRWPWRDYDNDGEPDDYFGDTYLELVLAWIAVCLTFLVIVTVLYYVR